MKLSEMINQEIDELLETHYQFAIRIDEWNADTMPEPILKLFEQGGTGFLMAFARDCAESFQERHRDTLWGVEADWYDTIDSFLDEKVKAIRSLQSNEDE
jgi:hypothetical protein